MRIVGIPINASKTGISMVLNFMERAIWYANGILHVEASIVAEPEIKSDLVIIPNSSSTSNTHPIIVETIFQIKYSIHVLNIQSHL